MKQALENATDEDRAAINEMLAGPQPAAGRARAGRRTPRSSSPSSWTSTATSSRRTPRTIDELLDSLAQRAAAAQRMRNSMTQEQRDELDALAAAGLRLARADAVAVPARRQPAGAAARRGLGRLRADGRRGGTGSRRRHRCLPGPRRPRRALRPALAVLRRRPDGRPRPRQALPAARRRGRGRRPHPAAAREGAARLRHAEARLRRPAQADPEGDAPARQGAAARRRRADVRAAGQP